MAHVIFRHHHKAMPCEEIGKVIIPLHMLRHTVDDLQHRHRFARRLPAAAVDHAFTGGRKVKIRTHRQPLNRSLRNRRR